MVSSIMIQAATEPDVAIYVGRDQRICTSFRQILLTKCFLGDIFAQTLAVSVYI